ncbi:hypothetical protein CVV38_03350 [Candidatus Peregrinibacteria bacterium HGW-Peregrinibacteria-1]|jgi:ribosome-associated translation inhibitor RaiA|nr:MAG: hypothetical protein CVV38_03350 [Candidatus Peregrinibacteria bacterium HGW-Peregrinibacteria-1]
MRITYSYKGLLAKDEKRVAKYFAGKVDAIKVLLKKYDEDAVLLNVVVEKFEKHDAFQVDLRLTLPSANLVAQEVSHGVEKALDDSKGRLVVQIKKHLAQLRKDRDHRSIKELGVKSSVPNVVM